MVYRSHSIAEVPGPPSGHPPGAIPSCRVVARVQVADDDSGRFVRGVDKLVVANVNPDMRQTECVRVLEKDQVARLELLASNRSAVAPLRRYRVPDLFAQNVHHDPAGEPRTVKRVRSVGCPDVGIPDILHRVGDDAGGARNGCAFSTNSRRACCRRRRTDRQGPVSPREIVAVHVTRKRIPCDRIETVLFGPGDPDDDSFTGNRDDRAAERWA